MVWTKVVDKGKIPYGKGEEFDVNGKKIAIFNKDGYYALDAMCAHQNNSIACGETVSYTHLTLPTKRIV